MRMVHNCIIFWSLFLFGENGEGNLSSSPHFPWYYHINKNMYREYKKSMCLEYIWKSPNVVIFMIHREKNEKGRGKWGSERRGSSSLGLAWYHFQATRFWWPFSICWCVQELEGISQNLLENIHSIQITITCSDLFMGKESLCFL